MRCVVCGKSGVALLCSPECIEKSNANPCKYVYHGSKCPGCNPDADAPPSSPTGKGSQGSEGER
jgi:hypothetical protein